jgi:RNA polymerase sigma-70 factor (ECF subfamily)
MSKIASQDSRRTEALVASNLAAPLDRARNGSAEPMADIVAGCQQGNRHAQQQLYEQCHERVFRLLVRMVGQQDAPDALQQVFLQVFSKIGQFSGRALFETWLYRLAINECLQFRRRTARVHFDMPADEPIDPSAEPVLRAQQQELMERALAQLAPELRAIFLLKEVEGMSYREIANTLQIKMGTVGSRLNQARAQLRNILTELGWNPES